MLDLNTVSPDTYTTDTDVNPSFGAQKRTFSWKKDEDSATSSSSSVMNAESEVLNDSDRSIRRRICEMSLEDEDQVTTTTKELFSASFGSGLNTFDCRRMEAMDLNLNLNIDLDLDLCLRNKNVGGEEPGISVSQPQPQPPVVKESESRRGGRWRKLSNFMEHFSRPEATVENLLAEFTSLKRVAVEMGKIEDKRIDPWLRDVKNRERDIDEIKQESTEIDELDGVLHSSDSGRAVNLHMKVIQSVKAVKAFKEMAVEMFLGGIPEDKLKRFSYDDLISFTSQPPQEIGSGGFGKVYKGQFANGVQVAIKILIPKDVTEEIFMSEMSTMLQASHPNIIQLYGFCSNAYVKALVYEFMEKGSLDVVLFKNPFSVEWETMYHMAIGIAKALAYLHHGCSAQIIHHDLKPSNVLLDPNHSPKVADFGTTRIMNKDMSHFTMTQFRGTRGYIAPEMGMYLSKVTYKCDVFSFGRVLFDILGMRSNTKLQHSLPTQVWNKFDKGELDVAVKDCGLLEKDIKRGRILSMIALWCIQHTPEIRPSMTDVVSALEEKIKVAKPPNPFLAWDRDFSMLQSEDVNYSTVSPATYESNSQPNHINPPAHKPGNPSKLTEDWDVLYKEMGALKRFRDEVGLKEAQQMAPWLENVKSKEEEFDVLQNEFNEYNGSLTDRHRLNRKMLRIRSSVNALQEVGNAVAHATATATSFSDLSFENQRRFTHADVRNFTANFSKKIGHSVSIGQFPNGVKIVVKKLKKMDYIEEIFMAEMRALLKMSHLNVVKLHGFCFEKNMKALVFQYMPKRSLDLPLFDNHYRGIEWEKLYDIAIETAKGLSYLHDGCGYQIIHGDVKASNVLLDSDFCPKVTNFGISKLQFGCFPCKTLSNARGDPTYNAPEMMATSQLTDKCDVYSFGMVLFEVLGRRRNIQGEYYFPMLVWKLFENREFEEIITQCGITEKNREKAMILCMVALWCIQYTPENRPSLITVVKMLEKEIKVAMPPDPFVPSIPYSVKPFVDVVYDFD